MLYYIYGSRTKVCEIQLNIVQILKENNLWESVKSQKPFVLKNSGLPDVTWREILTLLYADLKIGKNLGQGGKIKYDDFGFKIMRANRIQQIEDQFKELKSLFVFSADRKEAPGGAQIYMSLATYENSYGTPHSDPENIFFWQIRGKSNWKIWDKDTVSIQLDEVLEPGDILYCPPNLQHHIIAVTQRAGVSMGFGDLVE